MTPIDNKLLSDEQNIYKKYPYIDDKELSIKYIKRPFTFPFDPFYYFMMKKYELNYDLLRNIINNFIITNGPNTTTFNIIYFSILKWDIYYGLKILFQYTDAVPIGRLLFESIEMGSLDIVLKLIENYSLKISKSLVYFSKKHDVCIHMILESRYKRQSARMNEEMQIMKKK